MKNGLRRRDFLHLAAASGALCLCGPSLWPLGTEARLSGGASQGPRRTPVKVARIYMGTTDGLWPKPDLDFEKEIACYKSQFATLKDELSDVEFPVDALVTSAEQVKSLAEKLTQVDGILALHFNMGIVPILQELLKVGQPTVVFARPYSGHEWTHFGELQEQPLGTKLECILSSNMGQLAVAIRPFRALHYFREAKVLDLTTSDISEFAAAAKDKFGTAVRPVSLERVVSVYESIN